MDTTGVFRPANATFYLSNSNDQGFADVAFGYGWSNGKPIAGDWNSDGIDSIGLFNTSDGYFYLRNANSAGNADLVFAFGSTTDVPIAGNWDGVPSMLPPTPTPSPTPVTPPALNASFSYDGDGQRVKSTINSTTTYLVGTYFEMTGSTVTKYYYAGSQRIAIRTGLWDHSNPVTGTLNFMLGDHLGSTSLTTDSNGNVVSEMWYTAWGEVRYASGNTPTKYQYTGQFSYESQFGLYYYNARWLDLSLGRFAQADTFIPGGVQGLDRYAYALNNPIAFIDPSGHMACDHLDGHGSCIGEPKSQRNKAWVTFSKDKGAADWTDAEMQTVEDAAKDIGGRLLNMWMEDMQGLYKSGDIGSIPAHPTARKLYFDVLGLVDFHRLSSSNCNCWGQFHSNHQVYIYAHAKINSVNAGTRFIVHELGHVFDNRYSLNPRNAVAEAWRPGAILLLPHRSQDPLRNYGGFAGRFEGWQQSEGTDTWEEFADMFVGWIYGKWSTGAQGTQRSNFMNHYMPTWVNPAGD